MSNYYNPEGFALEIFQKRYAIHTEETWLEACDRVAGHIAMAEYAEKGPKYKHLFAELLKRNLFIPGGRILYGSGRPKGQLLNCFSKHVPIVTERGVIPISEAKIGDRALTHDGTFQSVINVFEQGHRDTLLSINVDRMPDVLQVTPDHKILTKRGWIKAEELLVDQDYISVPGFNEDIPVPKEINIIDFLNLDKTDYEVTDGFVRQKNSGTSKNGRTGIYSQQVKPVKNTISIDINLAKFMGYYISEGCSALDGYQVIFTFNANETDFINETAFLFREIFNLEPTIQNYETWVQVRVSSKILNEFLHNWLGPSFDKKKYPWWIFSTERDFRLTVLAYTCRGDGHTNKIGSTSLTMCNPTSMQQMFFLAQKLGLAYSLKYGKPKEERHAIPVHLNIARSVIESDVFIEFMRLLNRSEDIVDTKNYWRLVKNVIKIPYNDIVYDISVDKNHSVQVAGMVASNCFAVPAKDSREGWGKCISDMVVISGTGGGLGLNGSNVRPRGSPINGTGGTATGAVSLFEVLNAAGGVIKAGGGRRTALMFCLNLTHGDIIEFLDKKLDENVLNNANISVNFNENPEDLFKKVKKDEKVDLAFRGKIITSVPAKTLWERLVRNSLKNGEPGLLNGYLANKMNNIWYYKQLDTTNPCQPSFAPILTPLGISTIGKINVGDTVWSGSQWTTVSRKIETGIKPVFAYKTKAGIFYGTEEHRVLENGEKIQVKNATSIDTAQGPILSNIPLDSQTIMDGLVLGDGMVHKASNDLVVLNIGEKDGDYHRSEIQSYILKHRPGLHDYCWEIKTTIQSDEIPKTYDRKVPDRFRYGNTQTVRSFLRGLYSANGSVVGGQRVTLKASSFSIIESVQMMLSSLGIRSYYTTNKTKDVDFSNGTYTCKQSYDLNITVDRRLFAEQIGFIQKYKQTKLVEICELRNSGKSKKNYEITDIEELGDLPVYDITVEADEHTYWSNGLLISNCGEAWIPDYGCCDLGSLVLPRFVINKEIDYELLKEAIVLGVRFLDDVLTVNNYPLPEIKEMATNIRQIGLGVMGLHDMLLLLGLKYTSDAGLEMINKVMNFIKNAAYEASIELAKEKGAFPKFEPESYIKSGFIKTLKPSLRSKIQEFGIRNCALLTIAPTGTTSLVCGVTSGIEPMFAPAYVRKFQDGDKLKSEVVIHPLFKKAVEEGKSVKHFQGTQDLKIKDHFEVQRICQKHLDAACSKTISIPQDTTEEELSDLFMEYLPELKGTTIYREGSRKDQPLTPLSLDEALKHVAKAKVEATAKDGCKNGTCDI